MVNGQHQRLIQTNCKGDIFTTNQSTEKCNGNHSIIIPWASGNACQCLPPSTTFRPDNGMCVDKLEECLQVTFEDFGPITEAIPLVSSILHGQKVHFGAQLALNKVIHFDKFVCQVSDERFLSNDGWTPLTNITSTEHFNFQLIEMSNRKIGLQFLGSDDERWKFEMKLIRVDLSCVTAEKSNIVPQPCIAFRTATTYQTIQLPSMMVDEQRFLGGSGTSKWMIVSLGAGLLGVTYVLAILVYVIVRKNSSEAEKQNDDDSSNKFSWMRLLCLTLKKSQENSIEIPNEIRGRLYCDSCMVSSCASNETQMNFQPKVMIYKSNEGQQNDATRRPNVTVVSVGGDQSDHVLKPTIKRSKSDVGRATAKYSDRHGGHQHHHRKQSIAKRSESMTANSKSVSFDPNDTIISPKRADNLVTFASLCQNEKSIGLSLQQPSASILKKTEEQLQSKCVNPPRFLISSFNKKQRANILLKKNLDDSDYHSSDSDRFNFANRLVDFTETI
ncbi:hypothetical protein CHUAL_004084 [Chamberlinius hualienensis]